MENQTLADTPADIAQKLVEALEQGFAERRKKPGAKPWEHDPGDKNAFRDLLINAISRNGKDIDDGVVKNVKVKAKDHGKLVADEMTERVPLFRILELKRSVSCTARQRDGEVKVFGIVCEF